MKPLSDRESTGEDVQLESGFPAAVDIGDSASFTSMPQAGGQLKRKLRSRHVQMIAIGSCIGTGLLIGCGKVLHTGGPLSLVLSFALVGVALAIMMQGLGELAVVLPVSGGITDYATRFFNNSLGFAVGWQYWLAWVAIFGAEASAFSLLIGYWNDEHKYIPLWISIFIIVNLAVHLFPVNVFAEVEVVVSAVKIISILIFIIVVWVIMGGGGPHGAKHGAENWHLPELDNGVLHGFRGIASGFVTAAFATGGTEMVAIVAGEMQAPRRDLPAAINLLMWRIFVFYVVAMLFLTFVVPYNNEALIGGSKTNSSPFIQAIKGAGIQALPDILNAVVMVCVCSVASSSVYIASRTLKTMADMGYAFRIFNKVDAQGRPWTALIFTASVSIVLAYLNCSSTGAIVFSWFSAISGEAFFIVWMVFILCNWRFRGAVDMQKDDLFDKPFAFRQPLYPWLPMLSFVMFLFMLVSQVILSLWPIDGQPTASKFFSDCLSLPLFIVMWAGHQLWSRQPLKNLKVIDLHTGRRRMEVWEMEELQNRQSLKWYQQALSYLKL